MPALTKTKLERYRAYAEAHPEDKQFARGLAQLAEQTEHNHLLVWGPLYEEQEQFLSCWERNMLFSGGTGSGKTEVGAGKALIELIPREDLPEHLRPYKHTDGVVHGRVVSPGQATTAEVVVVEKLRKLCPPHVLAGRSWNSAYDKQSRILHFACGSWLQFLSAEQTIDKHSGAALGFCWFDEEPQGEKGYQLFVENTGRLFREGGRFWMTSTPYLGVTWSVDELYEKEGEPGYKVFYVDLDRNPTIPEEDKKAWLAGLSKEELTARKEGKPVYLQGVVYNELSADRHIIDPITPDQAKDFYETIVGIDPGVHTTAVNWVGFDKQENAICFCELELHEKNIRIVSEQIKMLNAHWHMDEPDYYVIDPSFINRTQFVESSNIQAEFERFGIYCSPAYNARDAGALQIKRRLEHGAFHITRDCPVTFRQFRRLHYVKKPDGTYEIAKGHDHNADATRYAVVFRTWGPEMAVKRESNYVRWNYGESFDGAPQQPELEMV